MGEVSRGNEAQGAATVGGHGDLAVAGSGLTPRSQTLLPFVAVSVVAIAGVFLPGGQVVSLQFARSMAALATTAALAIACSRTGRRWLGTAAAAGYLVFVVLLVLAQGSVNSGSLTLMLVPALWMSLYGTPSQSRIVGACTVATVVVASQLANDVWAVTSRRTVLWGFAVAVVSVTVHELRRRYEATLREHEANLRETRILGDAVREVAGLRTAAEVVAAGTRVAAELCCPAAGGRRGVYFKIEGEDARILHKFDEANGPGLDVFPIADHPALAEVVATNRPVVTVLDPDRVRGSVRGVVREAHLTHAAAVPVMLGGRLHGVIGVAGRGRPVTDVERLIDLAGIVELALANALANEALEREATTDALTGALNRRGLSLAVKMLPARQPFALIAADLDGLKQLNDREGHEAGDGALIRFVTLVQEILRRGDVVARVGGDEFVILAQGADEDAGAQLTRRIFDAVAADAGGLRVSLGLACGSHPGEFDDASREADRAMYLAKNAAVH